MSSITCLAWIKKGSAKRNPDRVKLDADELKNIILQQEDKLKNIQLSSDEDEISEGDNLKRKIAENSDQKKNEVSNNESNIDEIVQKYNLENYDDESYSNTINGDDDDLNESDEDDEASSHPLSIAGVSQFTTNKDDPYIQDEHDSDAEDDVILSEDNIIAVGKVDGSFCNLEFYCYNEENDNMYCHHDILLPSFPLALTWLNYDPSENVPGNLVALGTMEPDIEIWDVDIMDSVAPVYILEGSQKKKGKKKKKISSSGHTDAVLDLDWNHLKGNLLASASVDHTIGLWDLTSCSMASSIKHHEDKVQTLSWHPFEAQYLASGGYDCMAKMVDCRSHNDSHKSWKLSGEVERIIWNKYDPFFILASTDVGIVHYIDIRSDNVVYEWSAHQKSVSGLCLSSSVPGCLLTTGDKCVKVWDIRSDKPTLVLEKKISIGNLGCASASPDSNFIFAVGGEKEVKVLKINRHKCVKEHFSLLDMSNNNVNIEANFEISANNVDDDEECEALGLAEASLNDNPVKKPKTKKKKKSKYLK